MSPFARRRPANLGLELAASFLSSPNSNRGWLYRWNDDTEAWDYVIGDPSSSVYIDQIASSEAYASQIGWIGSSNVWATENSGRLYYLLDRVVPK